MRAFVLDREDRTGRIENVRREGKTIYRKDKEYAMSGISWAWGTRAIPRSLFALQFLPFAGPALSYWFLTRDTFVLLADGVPATLEPQGNEVIQSMTDEQARAIAIAHSEALGIGRGRIEPIVILGLGALAIAAIAIVGLLTRVR